MANKHNFRAQQKVKYLGNEGIIQQVSPYSVTIWFTGPFLYGVHTYPVGCKEFKELKKG